jgi:type I restriction enzyme S subunit
VTRPTGWTQITVGELAASFRSGDAFLKLEYTSDGVPVLAKGDIKPFGRIEHSEKRFLEASIAETRGYTLTEADDLLVTTRDLTQKADVLGLASPVPHDQPYLVNQGANVLRLKNPELNRYFVYWTNGPIYRDFMRANFVGSTQIHIRHGDVMRAPVWLPPDGERIAIVEVLGALDDKIEQNRRTSRALEGLARATFKAWFVEFEPVQAKIAGATTFPGMPPAVFAALPDRLTDSSLGPVPEGWTVRTLAEAFDINPPRRLSRGQDAAYLDMKNMPTDGHAPDTWERRPHGSGMRFINGDTLVARITPCLENGKTAYVDFLNDGEVGWGSTEYIVFRPKPPLPEVYAYYLARTPEFRDFAIQNMTGTSGRQRVAASALEHYHVAVPDAPTAAAFGEIARPLFECISAGKAESFKLATLRDYLLPRLLSGTVRVKSKGEP